MSKFKIGVAFHYNTITKTTNIKNQIQFWGKEHKTKRLSLSFYKNLSQGLKVFDGNYVILLIL